MAGSNYDLCKAAFESLQHDERSKFVIIMKVGDKPLPYNEHAMRKGAGATAIAPPPSPARTPPAAAADPRGMGGSMRSPAPQADGADPATQQQSAFAQSARSAALAKKWKKELAELSAMGLAAYADGLPELLEQTNGSIDEALDLLMA